MKRVHLGIGALLWLGAWLSYTTLSNRLAPAPNSSGMPAPMPSRGEAVAATCSFCHALDSTRAGVGPYLLGVVGRRAGSVPGYRYSPAMRNSGIVWTRAQLRSFLMNPQGVVPGTAMALAGWSSDDAEAVTHLLESPR
jgi:cytochrome c